jgi:hypothetical protein
MITKFDAGPLWRKNEAELALLIAQIVGFDEHCQPLLRLPQ